MTEHRNRPQTLTGIETENPIRWEALLRVKTMIEIDLKPLQGLKQVKLLDDAKTSGSRIEIDLKPLQGLKRNTIGTSQNL